MAAFLSGRSSQATPPMVNAPAIEAIMPHRVTPPEVVEILVEPQATIATDLVAALEGTYHD